MSNTTFNEEIESWYRNWMKAKGKAGPAVTVNILDMLKDFASQYQPTPSKELKSADADNLSIDELLSEFKRHGFDTSNWDGDEGAEKAIVYGVKNHISQLRPVSNADLKDNMFMNGGNTDTEKKFYAMGYRDGQAATPDVTEAVDMIKFIGDNGYAFIGGDWYHMDDEDGDNRISHEELYSLFKTQKQ